MPRPFTLSAGIIPFRSEDGAVLLLRAYRNWDFPKGVVEPGEKPLEAAVRELEEETGLNQVSFSCGLDFYETKPYAGGKVARFYVGEIRSGEAGLPHSDVHHRPEHHELRWMAPEAARALLVPRLRDALDWGMARRRTAREDLPS